MESIKISENNGAVAQLDEHESSKFADAGSNPVSVIRFYKRMYANLALTVEQLISNQWVIGSNPIVGFACKLAPKLAPDALGI